MPRYFLEVSYKGTNYSGFQVQENAITVQSEVEKALQTIYRQPFRLTGSSRTDAGVHALSNYFHFDTELILEAHQLYGLNAVLPPGIAAKGFYKVGDDAHSRFGATSREYKYFVYSQKNPFLTDRAWYYPFRLDMEILHEAAALVLANEHFIAFSKRNTQVNNYRCAILASEWSVENQCLVYHVKGNRFLRGMVRALVSSMLKVSRGTLSIEDFRGLLNSDAQAAADFSAPAHGLFLTRVEFPANYMAPL